MIDPHKFGVTVAVNRGMSADAFSFKPLPSTGSTDTISGLVQARVDCKRITVTGPHALIRMEDASRAPLLISRSRRLGARTLAKHGPDSAAGTAFLMICAMSANTRALGGRKLRLRRQIAGKTPACQPIARPPARSLWLTLRRTDRLLVAACPPVQKNA